MPRFALVCALSLAACAASFAADEAKPAAPAAKPAEKEKTPPNTISIDNFVFTPQSLTVAPGTTVTWINRDDVPHTVKHTEGKFKSGTLDTDEKFSFTFTDEGTFKYFCTVHAHMTGEIIVKK